MKTQDKFILPKMLYGPMCMKALDMFIKHHCLKKDSELPTTSDKPHDVLSKIFDVMIQTLPKEKRKILIKESEEYCNSLPPSFH